MEDRVSDIRTVVDQVRFRCEQRLAHLGAVKVTHVEPRDMDYSLGVAVAVGEAPVWRHAVMGCMRDAILDPVGFADSASDALLKAIEKARQRL
jgi:hypothetical protein